MITPFTPHMSPQKTNYFLSQPHQPFFIFGVFWAIVSMFIFALSHHGMVVLTIPENVFHIYSLVFIVLTQFFHGFLFTTFPRFCNSPIINKAVYVRIAMIYQISAGLFFLGACLYWEMAVVAMAGILCAHLMAVYELYRIYKIGQAPLKHDPFWILVAHFIGGSSHILLLIAVLVLAMDGSDWTFVFVPIIVNLYLILLTFTVGKRMIPFFSHAMGPKSLKVIEITFTLLVIKTVFNIFALVYFESFTSIVIGVYLLQEFLRWKLPLFNSPAILWILHLALFWLPAALILGGIIEFIEAYNGISLLFAEIHLLLLGFITTVLIGFGTRVTLGHSGQPPHADKLAIGLFWWTQVVVFSRFLFSIEGMLGWNMGWLFDLSVSAWIVMFIVWGGRYGKILVVGK